MNVETLLWKVQEPTRFRILALIEAANGDAYVHQLARRLHVWPNRIEHHLKFLRKWDLIRGHNRVDIKVRRGKPVPLPRTLLTITPKAHRLLMAIRRMQGNFR